MSQIAILKRATIAIVLAGTAATLLLQHGAPAASFHTVNPAPAAAEVEYTTTAPDVPVDPAMLVQKSPLRIQYVPIELSGDRMLPTPMRKG